MTTITGPIVMAVPMVAALRRPSSALRSSIGSAAGPLQPGVGVMLSYQQVCGARCRGQKHDIIADNMADGGTPLRKRWPATPRAPPHRSSRRARTPPSCWRSRPGSTWLGLLDRLAPLPADSAQAKAVDGDAQCPRGWEVNANGDLAPGASLCLVEPPVLCASPVK